MTRTYGPLQPDVTPPDLLANGYVLRRHIDDTCWCWWHRNPHGSGEVFGAPEETIAKAVDNARWLIGRVWQMSLLEASHDV